jgi:hypothetical protein
MMSPLPQEEESEDTLLATLDEPVATTLMRDVRQVGRKMRCVLAPTSFGAQGSQGYGLLSLSLSFFFFFFFFFFFPASARSLCACFVWGLGDGKMGSFLKKRKQLRWLLGYLGGVFRLRVDLL